MHPLGRKFSLPFWEASCWWWCLSCSWSTYKYMRIEWWSCPCVSSCSLMMLLRRIIAPPAATLSFSCCSLTRKTKSGHLGGHESKPSRQREAKIKNSLIFASDRWDQLACTLKPSWLKLMMQGVVVVSSSSQFGYRPMTSSSDPMWCRPGLQDILLKKCYHHAILFYSFPCTILRLAMNHLTSVMSSYTAYDSMITEVISWELKLQEHMHVKFQRPQ